MKAYGNSFSLIRNSYRYEIPFFQRSYVWDEENWRDLLESLSNPNDCPFLGSIILKKNSIENETVSWTVIDGQQRLTTLSILMRACYDELFPLKDTERFKAKYDDDDPWSDEVRVPFSETAYIKRNGIRYTKIQHSRIDHVDYENVIKGNFKESYLTIGDEEPSKIIRCYCFFRKQLNDKGINVVDAVWSFLSKKVEEDDETGKYLVIIELSDKENEQAIFDTINTAGVRLTCADTIKNSLFQKYIESLKNEGYDNNIAIQKAIKLYEEEWDSIFSNSAEYIAYWNKPRRVGRMYRDNIELLLHCIAVINGFFDPSEKKLSDLPQCYKDHISSLSSDQTELFIKTIKKYAKLYKDSFEELNEKTLYLYSEDEYLKRIMHIVDVLDISTFLPYILYLLSGDSLSENASTKDQFLELERYLILHAVCGETTKNYNKECIQLINGTSIDSLLANCENITQSKYEYGLRHMNSNKLATLLLFWVELYKRNANLNDLKELHYVFTLEHIMPQKWEEHWSVNDLPVFDEDGNKITDSVLAKQLRANSVYEIGNMTLLNGKLNTSVSNHTYKIKINGEGRKRGMKDLADCYITRQLIDLPSWDEKMIRERTVEIEKAISTIWGITFS